jgi:hypothetical protein
MGKKSGPTKHIPDPQQCILYKANIKQGTNFKKAFHMKDKGENRSSYSHKL